MQSLGVILHEQSRFIDGSSVNPIEEASLILNDTSEGLVLQEDLVSSARNDLNESSIKCFKRDASCHDESSLCDDSSVFDSSWLSFNSSDEESSSDNIWDFRRFSYKVQGNSEVKLSNSTSFCSLTNEEKVDKSSYDHLLTRNISEAIGFEDFGIDEPLFWPLERKFDWNSEEKWDVICISPTKRGGMVVAKYDGSGASKSVILSLNNSQKDANDNIIARSGDTVPISRLNISIQDFKKKDTSVRYTNSNSSVFNISWDFDDMGFLQSELLDNKISEAVDFNEFDVNSPLFWPSERKLDWNPDEKWDFLCISPCKNAGFDSMGFLPSDLFDEIMSEAVNFEDVDVDGPLFWPSERKVDWNPEDKWDFLCISPSKSGGKKIGSWTPPVKDLKELNSSVFFDRSSMSTFSLEYDSTSSHILDFDSMDFLPSDLFDENMSEAIEYDDVDIDEPLFWPSERQLDWNPEEKWDLICISPCKNEAKKAACTDYDGFSATTSSIKVKTLKRKQEDLKDECKRKKTRTVGEYGVCEEDFVSNNQIPIGFNELEKHKGISVDFDEDVDVNGALFWPLEERKFDWNPEEKWDVICISPCKNEGKIGNESTDECVPNKSIKLSSLKRKNEDLNDGFKGKKNKSIEDLEEAFLSKDEMLIEKMVGLNEFNGHEGVKDAYDERLFFLDEMQCENF